MAKEKKIGINFFLNERLKPGKFNGQDIFPIYARITFDRKNHQCPAPVGSMTKEQFEQKIVNSGKPEFNKILKEFEDKIRAVIAEEYNYFGDKFSFKGFSKRLERYDESLSKVVEKATKARLIEALSKELDKDELRALSFELYTVWDVYDIIRKNFPERFKKVLSDDLKINLAACVYLAGFLGLGLPEERTDFSYTKVIDWFQQSIDEAFKSFLIEHTPIDSKEKKQSLGFFTNESKSSPVWDLLFYLDITFMDIPLIIKTLTNTLIR